MHEGTKRKEKHCGGISATNARMNTNLLYGNVVTLICFVPQQINVTPCWHFNTILAALASRAGRVGQNQALRFACFVPADGQRYTNCAERIMENVVALSPGKSDERSSRGGWRAKYLLY